MHRQAFGNDSAHFHPGNAAFALARCRQTSCFGDIDDSTLETAARGGDSDAQITHAGIWAGQRSVVLIEAGRYALALAVTREGDACCMFTRIGVPGIVRPGDRPSCDKFVRETFVLGVMHGKRYDEKSSSGFEVQDLILI